MHSIDTLPWVCVPHQTGPWPTLDSDSQLRNVRSLELPSLLHTAGHQHRFLPHRMTSWCWYCLGWQQLSKLQNSINLNLHKHFHKRNAFLFVPPALYIFSWAWDSWIIHWLWTLDIFYHGCFCPVQKWFSMQPKALILLSLERLKRLDLNRKELEWLPGAGISRPWPDMSHHWRKLNKKSFLYQCNKPVL